ncbi:Polycomb group RING finger protein [Nesidiocoris tenuis]|uniref:Polycomb group RING finger protein n=1 Tax=Nesidiocoris tenuis TaxID=355587 RepID=A0ABN7BA54_9HEMI|nr:Polycomb group RING finger protein [Nesidiocoris tenuis]
MLTIKLRDINPFITCGLCGGYFINATTITECVHTFCRSCLLLHLKASFSCPACGELIHASQPLKAIRHDQTMQEIVNKFVPNLVRNERRREIEFYRKVGIRMEIESKEEDESSVREYLKRKYANGIDTNGHQYVCLEGLSENEPSLEQKFMLVPRSSTILQLKKLLASAFLQSSDKWDMVHIFCNGILQGKEHSIEFVLATRWRNQIPILVLQYSIQGFS